MILSMKNMKKSLIVSVLLCLVTVLGAPASVSAKESNQPIKLSYGQNYENKETGEYFRWIDPAEKGMTTAGTVAKDFEFKIRYTVESSSFTIDSSSVSVDATAWVENSVGDRQSGYSGHKYTVKLNRLLSSKSLQFDIGGTESGTISGLKSGGSYTVEVINNDYLSSGIYLVGYGSITNN
ncbi:hypothetical protein [Paenibacillus faecalis]|uniref:hypothetical protein n=1 Tax=Paenibacillus faecalis TaxID=2079532 RepID=UPI000D10493F|nr:hypothetical protein [Paenibacillus faecalis]